MKIILASKSPRRKEILKTLGFDFEIHTADTDENCDLSEPSDLVKELSRRKGADVLKMFPEKDTLIISCDTVVACDGKILGKPHTKDEAKDMLCRLSGKAHTVISGLTLSYNGKTITDCDITKVFFAKMPNEFIESYVESGEPMDKAGAYAIQGKASLWIEKIDGCYFNVVGLPVRLLREMIDNLGISNKNFWF